MKNSGVVCHGDCDGIISAFLYIKHYLRDAWPKKVNLVFTQPWRAHVDARKIGEDLNEAVFLDIALSREFVDFLKALSGKVDKLVVIDHHRSSAEYLKELQALPNARTIWRKAPSCPRLMLETLKPCTNPYESFLVEVADVCEGAESRREEVGKVADLIKLAIARDPGDLDFMTYLIDVMLQGKDLSTDKEVVSRAKVAKFLLRRLLKIMGERALEVASVKIVALTLPESRVYAGLLGIASTEFARMRRKDVILVRREEGKVVVTVRTINDRAYRICKELAERTGGRFGGHGEAASATLPDMSLEEAVKEIVKVVKDVPRESRTHRMYT